MRVCACVCVCVCGDSNRENTGKRIRYRHLNIWTTRLGTESRIRSFLSEKHNVSSVLKSLCNETVSLNKSSHSA